MMNTIAVRAIIDA